MAFWIYLHSLVLNMITMLAWCHVIVNKKKNSQILENDAWQTWRKSRIVFSWSWRELHPCLVQSVHSGFTIIPGFLLCLASDRPNRVCPYRMHDAFNVSCHRHASCVWHRRFICDVEPIIETIIFIGSTDYAASAKSAELTLAFIVRMHPFKSAVSMLQPDCRYLNYQLPIDTIQPRDANIITLIISQNVIMFASCSLSIISHYYDSCNLRSAMDTTLSNSIARVIGPTPPGFGV